MMDGRYPRLVDVFPELVAEIVELLAADDDALAETITDLPFLGPCKCSPTCTNLLTAPPGSSGSYVVQLQRDGDDVIWLSLDETATAVTDIEVLDGRDLGPAAERTTPTPHRSEPQPSAEYVPK